MSENNTISTSELLQSHIPSYITTPPTTQPETTQPETQQQETTQSVSRQSIDVSPISMIMTSHNDFNTLLHNFLESDKNLDLTYKMRTILETMEPLITIYFADRFYLADIDKIPKYIETFKQLFLQHKTLLKYMFQIFKVLPINSANGRIFVLKSLTPKIKPMEMDIDQRNPPTLLVKVALSTTSDPISYEYFVGLSLNILRTQYNIDHFAIMYGRFLCGLNPKIDITTNYQELEQIKLCDDNFPAKTHLLYEYIKGNETENVMTLKDFIETGILSDDLGAFQVNLINIIILIMISLQKAQDILDFTHYDLHTQNILVVKLNQIRTYTLSYNDNTYIINTEVVPHIIDYGRSYINPNKALSDNDSNIFYDNELQQPFNDFKIYQQTLFKPIVIHQSNSKLDPKYAKKQLAISTLEKHLNKLAYRFLYNTELDDNYPIIDDENTIKFKKQILTKYYNGHSTINKNTFKIQYFDFGIDSRTPNHSYDFFRLIRIIGSKFLKLPNFPSYMLWRFLSEQLELQYPFHDGSYFSLSSNYKHNPLNFMIDQNDEFKTPIDIANFFYNYIYITDTVMQSGGGTNGQDNIQKTEKKYEQLLDTIMKPKKQKTHNDKIIENIKKKIDSQLQHRKLSLNIQNDANDGSFNL